MNQITNFAQQELSNYFDKSKEELLKSTICRGSNDEEFQLFLHACKRTGLDPFMRQIHAVKRWDSTLKREAMSIQTGIDGYRLIADRTGKYAPGKETIFNYDKDGRIISAVAYVKKLTADGTWHEISATAHYSEYVALTKEGKPTHMWATKAHIMLGKCAEALALRKAFPAELSGVYTKEEMEQADNFEGTTLNVNQTKVDLISKEQADELNCLISECETSTQLKIWNFLKLAPLSLSSLDQLPLSKYENLKKMVLQRRDEYLAKLALQDSSFEQLANEA